MNQLENVLAEHEALQAKTRPILLSVLGTSEMAMGAEETKSERETRAEHEREKQTERPGPSPRPNRTDSLVFASLPIPE